jgi:hypothetical protein
MHWHRSLVSILACLVLLPALPVSAQPEPTLYTFVALWSIPRDQWDNYNVQAGNARPILERALADGTLVSWGQFATVVHEEDGYTHGAWFSASSVGALERVRAELVKLPSPATVGARHRDYLFRSLIHQSKPASGSDAYLQVSYGRVQPGRGRDWRELWEKYSKPIYDDGLANGNINFYQLQVEDVHTGDAGGRWVVAIAPSAEAMDKFDAAFAAVFEKRGPVEGRAIGAAFGDVSVAGTHRDFLAKVTAYGQK